MGILQKVSQHRDLPKTIRVDNGPEFIRKVLDQWAYLNGVELDFSRPGKLTDNAFIEAFNASLTQLLVQFTGVRSVRIENREF